ncbi:MAG: hypothetical protein F2602_02835 [Actinobacteria bacterium]|uniref:Unannotated protein n=1 Tax=freshwater metagenome TaxID=449393 RepID=A0A6J6ICM6_9ZZZZ|nr:hypothetical protein [Actinomycetota bacterium]MTA20973.1 hypothetical protein [Actinomycetota bacterium]
MENSANQTRRGFGLRRGLSLSPAVGGAYRIGRANQNVLIASAFHRTAIIAMAQGRDPFLNVPSSDHQAIEQLIRSLAAADLLTQGRHEIALPPRYLNEIVERDLAAGQLRNRCEPELLQCEWSEAAITLGEDEGANILAARAEVRVHISGRNRIATLLHSLLLASGVSLVEYIDHSDKSTISDTDIGTSTITSKEYAMNFYGHLQSHRRAISLFPLDRSANHLRDKGDGAAKQAKLIIHSGPVDIEDLIDWLTAGQAHFVIQSPLADQITMGPLVLPGISPCLRCADLNQIDRVGYSSTDRIALTHTPEIAMVGAHFIASLAASQILQYIDSIRLSSSISAKSWPIAQVTTVNLQKLHQPQIYSITQHPLCGCQVFRDKSSR